METTYLNVCDRPISRWSVYCEITENSLVAIMCVI